MRTNETNNLAVAAEQVPNDPEPNNPNPNNQSPTNPGRGFSKRAIAVVVTLAACAALAIASGVRSRLKAETRLRESARASAIPFVDIVSPKASADADEIALPGSTSAFNDTPI